MSKEFISSISLAVRKFSHQFMSEHIEPQLSLGSKLTIISKAGIRYEGILYLIDTVKESIALQNVRFYGTEDRKVAKQHPPKSETFECIVFKASDLQDLTLVPEEQDPPTDPLSFQDPAVISSKPAATCFENETMKQESLTFVNRQLSSTEENPHKRSASNHSLAYPTTSDMSSSKQKHGGYQGYESSRGPYRNSGPDWGRPRNPPPPPQPAPTARGSGTVSFTQDFDFEEANSRFKKDEFAEEFRKKLKIRNTLSASQAEDESTESATTTEASVHSPTAHKPPPGDPTALNGADTTPTPAKPSGSATAEGREPGELRSEDESEDSGVEIAYYDKTKSFFDQISTDNPVNKRGKFREERSLNSQTFGVSSPPPGTGSRRGPRRGMRRGSDYNQYRNSGGTGGYPGEYRNTPRYDYEYEYEYYPPRNRGYAPRGYRRTPAPPPQGYYQGYPPSEHDYYDTPPPPPHEYYRPPRGPPPPRREENYNTNYVQSKTFRNSRIATGSSGNKPRDRNN